MVFVDIRHPVLSLLSLHTSLPSGPYDVEASFLVRDVVPDDTGVSQVSVRGLFRRVVRVTTNTGEFTVQNTVVNVEGV